ncbi:transposase [Streptomyces zhihengii]|uniref:transposase n=1 Tax=Streptomyces zhihengii TaxID=1818004 RepID=UPI0035572A4C
MWLIDDVSYPKWGTASAGVARQYCGALGKRASQVAVSVHAATDKASCPLDWQLYLPREGRTSRTAPARRGCRRKPRWPPGEVAPDSRRPLDTLIWASPRRLPVGSQRRLPDAKAHYWWRRDDHLDWHAAGQRSPFNRTLGQLHRCLRTPPVRSAHRVPGAARPSTGRGVGALAHDSPLQKVALQSASITG